jgi:hypothetical protein
LRPQVERILPDVDPIVAEEETSLPLGDDDVLQAE